MKMDPFIEAEEATGHSINRCCELFEVSRAAYYERKKDVPSPRAITDAELTEKIKKVHAESKGTYGYLRVHKALRKDDVEVGKRRVRRLMRQAGLEGRAKKRWRKTTVPDPAVEAAKDLDPASLRALCRVRPALCRRHHLRHDLGGLGLSGHRDRPRQPEGRRVGAG